VDNLESVGHDPKRHELLAGVSAVHHHRVNHSLDNRARCLAEPLLSVPTGSVWHVDCLLVTHGDVVLVIARRTRSRRQEKIRSEVRPQYLKACAHVQYLPTAHQYERLTVITTSQQQYFAAVCRGWTLNKCSKNEESDSAFSPYETRKSRSKMHSTRGVACLFAPNATCHDAGMMSVKQPHVWLWLVGIHYPPSNYHNFRVSSKSLE
jgi:hypothetical protein